MLARHRLPPLRGCSSTSRVLLGLPAHSHRRFASARPALSTSSELDRTGAKPRPAAFAAHPSLESLDATRQPHASQDKEVRITNPSRLPRRLKKPLDHFGVVDPEDSLSSNKGRHFQDELRRDRNRQIRESRLVKLGLGKFSNRTSERARMHREEKLRQKKERQRKRLTPKIFNDDKLGRVAKTPFNSNLKMDHFAPSAENANRIEDMPKKETTVSLSEALEDEFGAPVPNQEVENNAGEVLADNSPGGSEFGSRFETESLNDTQMQKAIQDAIDSGDYDIIDKDNEQYGAPGQKMSLSVEQLKRMNVASAPRMQRDERRSESYPFLEKDESASFAAYGLHEQLIKNLWTLGVKFPSSVQHRTIPEMLRSKHDAVIIGAETGSGKSLSFLTPVVHQLMQNRSVFETSKTRSLKDNFASTVILAPSIELCNQLRGIASTLLTNTNLTCAVFAQEEPFPGTIDPLVSDIPHYTYRLFSKNQQRENARERNRLRRVTHLRTQLAKVQTTPLVDAKGEPLPTVDANGDLVPVAAGPELDGVEPMTVEDKEKKVRDLEAKIEKVMNPPKLVDEGVYFPDILICTPNYFMERITPSVVLNTRTLIFDEGDMMLTRNLGHWQYVKEILSVYNLVKKDKVHASLDSPVQHLPDARFVFAGATLGRKGVGRFLHREDLSKKQEGRLNPLHSLFKNSHWITTESLHTTLPQVEVEWCLVKNERDHQLALLWAMGMHPKQRQAVRDRKVNEYVEPEEEKERTVIFCDRIDTVISVNQLLKGEGMACGSAHERMDPKTRADQLKAFTEGHLQVFVCTDLFARGIDFPNVSHVVQYTFARNVTQYIHRVGRTARAGRPGRVTNLYVARNERLVQAIRHGHDDLSGAFSWEKKKKTPRMKRVEREYGGSKYRGIPRGRDRERLANAWWQKIKV